MNHSLRHLVLCLVLLGGLRAQSPSPEDIVSLQFRIMAWHGDVPALSYGHRQKMDLTETASLSDIQTYTGPTTLTFTLYAEKPDPLKPAPVVASVLLPKAAKKVTLLTVPAGHGRYAMYVVPDDPASLPPRHSRLHNLTADRLLVGTGASDRVELAPATSFLASAPGPALVIRVARMVNGQWRELFNNVVELNEAGGPNVLLINGQQGAGIGMFAIPVWPKTPAATKPGDVARAR